MNHDSNICGQSTLQLLGTFVSVMNELRERGLVRSSNNPVADYSEYLVKEALGLQLVRQSTAGFDAQDEQGMRYEIKGRRLTASNPSRQVSDFRNLQEENFDYFVGVLFHENFMVKRVCRLDHAAVLTNSIYNEHTNAWRFHLRDTLWTSGVAVDLTELLQATQLNSDH